MALAPGGLTLWHRLVDPPSTAEVERQLAAHDNVTALQTAAGLLASDGADPRFFGTLRKLYAALCDSASGEPETPRANAALWRIVSLLHAAPRNDQDRGLTAEVLGDFALASDHGDMAAAALRRAKQQGAPAERVDVPLAQALLRIGRFQEVLDIAPETKGSPRVRATMLTLRGRAYLGLSQPDTARASFKEALAIDPDNANALSELGMLALWRDRDEPTAAALLAQAQRAAPDSAPTLRLAGEYAYAVGDYRGSAAAYGTLLRRGAFEAFDPTPPSLGEARALIYAGDVAAARSALDVSRLSPKDPSVRYYRALLAYRAGEFQHAAEQAQSLDAALPNYPPLDLLLGAANLANGFPSTAAARLARYVDAMPGNSAARHLLEIARRAMTDPHAPAASSRELLADCGFPMSAATDASRKDGF